MTIKYSKMLALAAAAAITIMVAPTSQAADPVVPVTTATSTTGSITVVQTVINDNNGTKTASDFMMSIKHWGTPIVGSPFVPVAGAGKTFILEAGTYVVSEAIMAGYDGTWSGEGIANGFIDLQPGQNVTIIRTLNDNGTSTTAPVVTEEPATEDGGVLPNTASPLFNFLLVGSLVAAAGAFGMRKSINLHKAN